MRIAIINGPNLNLLGKREPGIYGNASFEEYYETLRAQFPDVTFSYYQSNVEGGLINHLHEVGFSADGILLNAGGYTHTSIALHDALTGVNLPAVEVHVTNVHARESFRHQSFIAKAAFASLAGFGIEGYRLAIMGLAARIGVKAKA